MQKAACIFIIGLIWLASYKMLFGSSRMVYENFLGCGNLFVRLFLTSFFTIALCRKPLNILRGRY